MSYTLLSMAYSAPEKVLQDGVRAITILMMDLTTNSIGEEITSCVKRFLQPIVESIATITDNLEKATDDARTTWSEKQKETGHAHASANSEVTYAAALKGHVPLSHHTTLARA
jgi:hypothetical protein